MDFSSFGRLFHNLDILTENVRPPSFSLLKRGQTKFKVITKKMAACTFWQNALRGSRANDRLKMKRNHLRLVAIRRKITRLALVAILINLIVFLHV